MDLATNWSNSKSVRRSIASCCSPKKRQRPHSSAAAASPGLRRFQSGRIIPEFTADVGIKKGEKVDYAIAIDGKLTMLIECKPSSMDLDLKHASQLFRYFSTTDVRIAVLTNGVTYQFYSDIDQPNKMDDKPFFIFSMDAIRRTDPPYWSGSRNRPSISTRSSPRPGG